MSLKRKLAALAASVLAPAALAIALAGSASATTPAATSSALGAYAGTQVDGNSLAVDVYRQYAAAGEPIIGYPDSTADPATDFAWIVPPGSYPSGSKEAIYLPGGKDTNLCVTGEGTQHWLVLDPCKGTAAQVWANNGTGWVNAADRLVLTEHGKDGQLTDTAPVTGGSAGQTWTWTP